MDILNSFLMSLSVSTRNAIWYAFILLLVFVACILTGIYCFRKSKSIKSSFVCCCLAAISFAVVIAVALFVEKITDELILLSGVTYYIPYLLCASWLISRYLQCGFREAIDIISLAYLPARAVNIVGCTFAGCCQGIPAEWGIYSAVLKTNVIPVQLYESAAILIIWIALKYHCKSNSPQPQGKCGALSVVLFGGLNVISDIFTYIQPKLIYMLSVEGVFAFLTMCIGLIMLYVYDKKKNM